MPANKMVATFVCKCLNVCIHGDQEEVHKDQIDYIHQLIESIPSAQKSDIVNFVSNCTAVKLTLEGIVIQYNFLCFKRTVDNFQINYCAICEQATYATLINGSTNVDASGKPPDDNIFLVNSLLLNDDHKISVLKNDPSYSNAFGIKLPKQFSHSNQNENSVNVNQNELDANNENLWNLSSSDLGMIINQKVNRFLNNEKHLMNERIKHYSTEQENNFKELCQSIQEDENKFFQMVNGIKLRHYSSAIESDSFDKENISEAGAAEKTKRKNEKNTYYLSINSTDAISVEYIKKQALDDDESPLTNNNKQSSMRSGVDDDDALFDIDDIDVEEDKSGLLYGNSDPEAFEEEENESIYPLKESNIHSNDVTQNVAEFDDTIATIGTLPSDAPNIRSNRKMVSGVQNIPYYYRSKSRHNHNIPSSLPIKIPQFSTRKLDLDNDENFKIKPGESIADSIQKLARSVRNETDILDDRPRRRLNTGDLIKSRPILN